MTNTERIQANNAELREAIEMAESLPDVGSGGIIPTGTIPITENGSYEVTNYATAEVNVPIPKPVTEELSVAENGEYMPNDGVDGFSKVTVSVPAPVVPTQEKTVEITENGTVSVTPDEGYALSKVTANVNVPIPEGYIKPSGTKEITENGTHDAKAYESVSVAVPIPDGYIVPSGTLDVSENGTHDVTAYASVSVNVPTGGGGDTSIEDGLITRTLTEYENDRVTSVGAYAFYSWANLQSFDFPNAKTIGTQAFYNCDKLASVYLPAATSVGDNSFRGCAALSSVDCPSLTSVGATAFRECAKLTDLNFPNVRTIGNYAFHSCTALERIDLPSITSIATQVFANCSALALIIIRRESGVCSVSSIASFQGTPFASGGTGGTVLVPRAIVDSYKTTGQWKTLYGYGTNEILALEDFTVDGTITGELDEAKLETLASTRSASMALNRQYTETDEPIGGETDEANEADYQAALLEMGVEV